MANNNLTNAKRAKNDEFYTQYADIQKEIEAYLEFNPDVFRGQVVYCNCDDPFESNFFRYFVLNFNRLGLKQLITTSYKPSPVANTQLSLFGDDKTLPAAKGRPKVTANKFIINEVCDLDGDGEFNLKDIAEQLRANKHNEWRPLEGEGDFRSAECIELLKQSDIVATNPPFSLFREYVKQLFEYDKRFVIIGNMNAITYKEVFPLIKDNRLWLGNGFHAGNAYFFTPNTRDFASGVYDAKTGLVKFRNVCWFTNIDHGRRHQPLPLMTMEENLKYSKHKEIKGKRAYDRYDNYDAIEVPFTDAIPSDYEGVMGVPISFLDKYSPEQFEIVGATESEGKGFSNGLWDEKSGVSQPLVKNERVYKRIFIRHREVEMLEEYLDNLYKATQDARCKDIVIRRAIIDKVNHASKVVNMSPEKLLAGLDFKLNDLTTEALEAFLAELRSIFWLKDFGFIDIKPLAMGKKQQPDFMAKFGNKICVIEVFCLTQKYEQLRDSNLGAYKNFDPNFAGSKFGRDFISKANEKKKQLDSFNDSAMKILLGVINSSPIINLNTVEEMEKHAKFLFEQLKWGNNYFVGLLTGVETNGNITNVVYPKLPTSLAP